MDKLNDLDIIARILQIDFQPSHRLVCKDIKQRLDHLRTSVTFTGLRTADEIQAIVRTFPCIEDLTIKIHKEHFRPADLHAKRVTACIWAWAHALSQLKRLKRVRLDMLRAVCLFTPEEEQALAELLLKHANLGVADKQLCLTATQFWQLHRTHRRSRANHQPISAVLYGCFRPYNAVDRLQLLKDSEKQTLTSR